MCWTLGLCGRVMVVGVTVENGQHVTVSGGSWGIRKYLGRNVTVSGCSSGVGTAPSVNAGVAGARVFALHKIHYRTLRPAAGFAVADHPADALRDRPSSVA